MKEMTLRQRRIVVIAVAALTALSVTRYCEPMEAIEPVSMALMPLRVQIWRPMSGVMRASVRTCDLLCRFGGEEFVVICPDTDLEGAVVCAERVGAAVRDAQLGVRETK